MSAAMDYGKTVEDIEGFRRNVEDSRFMACSVYFLSFVVFLFFLHLSLLLLFSFLIYCVDWVWVLRGMQANLKYILQLSRSL